MENDKILGTHGLRVIRGRGQRFPNQSDWDRRQSKPNGNSDPVISIKRPELLVESKAERDQDPMFTDVNHQRVQVTRRIDECRADDLAIDGSVRTTREVGRWTYGMGHASIY